MKPLNRGAARIASSQDKLSVAPTLRFQFGRPFPWRKHGQHFFIPPHGLLESFVRAMRQHAAPIGKFQSGRIAQNAVIRWRRRVAAFHRFPYFHA